MNETIFNGLCSLLGTIIGILTAGKLTTYRLEQLELKVDKHNHLIERTYKIEEHLAIIDEKINVANHRIEDLEKGGR